MKIAIKLTVEVDVEGWEMDYGVDRNEIRADVQQYIHSAVDECNANLRVIR